jgi:hypothetical protein
VRKAKYSREAVWERRNTFLAVGTSSSRRQNFRNASGITELDPDYVSLRILYPADDLAGIATREITGASKPNYEVEEKGCGVY